MLSTAVIGFSGLRCIQRSITRSKEVFEYLIPADTDTFVAHELQLPHTKADVKLDDIL